jgi:hypothetical protein
MMMRGWLKEVDANLRCGEPLWRETVDGHGTTLVVTDAGLLAIGIEPVVVKTVVAIRDHAAKASAPMPPTQRAGTKQAMLIAMLHAPEGATMEAIITATGWQAHYADVRIMPMYKMVLVFRPVCSLVKMDQGFMSGC